jgi:hypothetical protein
LWHLFEQFRFLASCFSGEEMFERKAFDETFNFTVNTLLERDVHEWTSKWSTRGQREKWTFVKQILMVHAHGPCRRPRVDIAEVHAWTLCQVTSVGHPKKNIKYFEKNIDSRGIQTPVYCMEVQCLTN